MICREYQVDKDFWPVRVFSGSHNTFNLKNELAGIDKHKNKTVKQFKGSRHSF